MNEYTTNGDCRERPLLMADDLVLATERGEKTETRRPVKPQPNDDGLSDCSEPIEYGYAWRGTDGSERQCPYGRVGDRLWFRERARVIEELTVDGVRELALLRYESTAAEAWSWWPARLKRTPVGHCIANGVFREAARTVVKIVEVRVERVQSITEEGARAEGFSADSYVPYPRWSARTRFRDAWNVTYNESWDRNDWVWVIRYKPVIVAGRSVQ